VMHLLICVCVLLVVILMKRNVYTYEFDKTVVKFVIKLAHVLYSTSLFI